MGNTFSRTRRALVAPVKPSEPHILIIGAGITGRKYSLSAVVSKYHWGDIIVHLLHKQPADLPVHLSVQ